MRCDTAAVPLLVVAAACVLLMQGCAGTGQGSNIPDDPRMIRNELAEIENEIVNTEEMLKASRAELQIDDSMIIREEIREHEMNLIHLESRKKALEERLRELEPQGQS
jgi:type IV pilus biogenesis protein CpaD/CtpE